ncbi:S-type Pyocin [Vibrio ruber DSM 16370]|uniref:S-type Pyocin n=1 Tax=Vibrio ruber (strain DSM 16370 / JCM 11486 / BCRC 17186 / CECT 7878 / LMG 23124 / VR1) TaxID=1123498 RepID=A0A1R4LP40_VIBR1|nr:S-type pyocin domain-containing protein [Vibrio ruber]SJN58159.1 S-type Pyocin [Vibrio ruber DSM 16370]
MNYQTTQIYNLMRYEFAQVEGDFAALRESDVKSVIPAGIRFADFLEQLRSGHQVLLTDVPSIPLLIRDRDEWGNLYWRVNPAVEPHLDLLANKAYTARVEWVNHGIGSTYSGSVNVFVSTEPYIERKTVKLTLAERLVRQRQERLRELDKIPLPSSAWLNAFNKPPVKPSRFAKSALVPSGTCDIGTQRESLSALGDYAAYTLAIGQGVSAASGEAFLTRIGGAALAELPGMAMKIVGRAGILAAFVPNKLADSTLYSAADMRNKDTVETNIRLGFNTKGRIYGYHVNGANIPKREVKRVGERFVVELGPDVTIEWVPISGDFGGKPILVNPIPEMEKFDIWIHPQADQGQEFDNTYITPIADADLQDYILTFPAETGLPPLYVVYQKTDKPKVKPLEVGTYGELAARSAKDGMDIDHIPSRAALIRAAEKMYGVKLLGSEKAEFIKSAASIAIPRDVHQKCSETYGGRNQKGKQIEDAENLEKAVNSNFDAIKECLLKYGYTEVKLEEARDKLHNLNKENGWY